MHSLINNYSPKASLFYCWTQWISWFTIDVHVSLLSKLYGYIRVCKRTIVSLFGCFNPLFSVVQLWNYIKWCYRDASFVFENDAATVYPVRSFNMVACYSCLLLCFTNRPFVLLVASMMGNQPWRYSISVHVDSFELCILQSAFYLSLHFTPVCSP